MRQRRTANRWEERSDRHENKAKRNWRRYHHLRGHDPRGAKVFRTKAKRYEHRADICDRRAQQWDDDAQVSERQARQLMRTLQFVLALLHKFEPHSA